MKTSRTAGTLAALVFAAGALYVSPSFVLAADNPGIVGVGDFETGDFSQWKGIQTDPDHPDDLQIDRNVVRQGTYAARFTVHNGDKFQNTSGERAEVAILMNMPGHGATQGDDYYYAWSTQFSTNHPPTVENWAVFTQWHDGPSVGLSPPLSLHVAQDGGLFARLVDTDGDGHNYTIIDHTALGMWHDFVVHVEWSTGNDGRVQAWHKLADESQYTKVLDLTRPTLHVIDNKPVNVYLKQGYYRSSGNDGTIVVFHDGMVVGTNFDAVAHWAHGTPVPEPASAMILLLTGGGLMMRRRRKA